MGKGLCEASSVVLLAFFVFKRSSKHVDRFVA